jgi:hypothetical protein
MNGFSMFQDGAQEFSELLEMSVMFNIVIDAINPDIEVCRPKETAATAQLFYACDGAVAGDDPE